MVTDGEEAMVVRVVKVVLAYFILMSACVSDSAQVRVSGWGGAGEPFLAKGEAVTASAALEVGCPS